MRFGEMTIAELRAECKKRGAKRDGRKKDLVERLEAYQRNANFGSTTDDQPADFAMDTPKQSRYMDINLDSPLPHVTEESILCYLQKGCPRSEMQPICKPLYEERCLHFGRWAPGPSGNIFVRAKCYAQMKSGLSYLVDVEIDSVGVVNAAQCECTAGTGPNAHCKHVVAVLFGLSVHRRKGEVKTTQTCTQQLHAVKRTLGGSPVKAANMKLPFRDNVVGDPRPESRRGCPNYQNQFLNIWKACPGVGKMPVSHLFTPVNLTGVGLDHTYVNNDPEKHRQIMEAEEQAELSEVKIEIDIAEEPYWMTDQQSQNALIDGAVKLESDGDRNVLDSGCTSHEMEPMVVKTEVKEETDTDWDVKPTLSHTAGTTAFENDELIVKFESDGDNNVLDSGCTCHEMEPMVGKTEVKEETNTDWDVKPTLSHTAGTTAFENG